MNDPKTNLSDLQIDEPDLPWSLSAALAIRYSKFTSDSGNISSQAFDQRVF